MTPTRIPCSILASCLAWLLAVAIFQVAPAMENPDTDGKRLENRILSLIEQLGHDDFNRREFAQRKLGQLGLAAYDAVHRAQQHDDIEVAKRARYLVRSMRIQWSREYDPAVIRRILVGYGDKSPDERRNRMEELAHQDLGQLVLCRMVRYESTSPLSKYAALLIIQQERPADESQASALAASLHNAVRQSAQTAAGWIRVHAKTLEDPESALDQWEQICRQEETTLTQFPRETSREITRDLLREYATLLDKIDRKEQSLAVLRRTINLLDGTSKQLQEMVDWLVDNEVWSLVQDVAERFPSEFSRNPFLIYRLAESHLRGGDPQQADEVAARARAIDPENTRAHTLMAIQLQKQNLVRWSIEEFRLVLEKADLKSRDNLYARFLLSEMLHDQEKEVEAASVLEGAIEAVRDERIEREVEQVFGRTPAGITSRRLYFLAMARKQASMFDEQRTLLEEAIETDPSDGDVLIAMYRFKQADEAFKKKTLTLVEAAIEHHRVEIELYKNAYRVSSDAERETAKRKLAGANNQFAWLASNTIGDYKDAVRCSLKSLELRPGSSSYLDTLGHCYYAAGNYAEAVKAQQQAVNIDPSSQQMLRMLKVFQDALAKSQENK